MKAQAELQHLLARLDACAVECDGFTRLASRVLHESGYDHQVFLGSIVLGSEGMAPHFWIELDGLRVDYRARMWLGEGPEVPHGVVPIGAFPAVQYDGEPCDLPPADDLIFAVLTAGVL